MFSLKTHLTEQSRHYGILFMQTFYTDVVNSVICFAKEAGASISWLANEYNLSCKIEKPHSVRGM